MRREQIGAGVALTVTAAPWVRLWDSGDATCDGCGHSFRLCAPGTSMQLLSGLWAVWLAAHRDCTVRAVG
jgi:hypothetical protein